MEKMSPESALAVNTLDTAPSALYHRDNNPNQFLANLTGEYEEDVVQIDPRTYGLWMTHALAPFFVRLPDNDRRYTRYLSLVNQLYNSISGLIDDRTDHLIEGNLWTNGMPQCGNLAKCLVESFALGAAFRPTDEDQALIIEAAYAQHTFSEDRATDPTYDSSMETIKQYYDRITAALADQIGDADAANGWSALRIERYLYQGLLRQQIAPIIYERLLREDGIYDRIKRQYHPPVKVYIGATGAGKSTCDKAMDEHRDVAIIVCDRFRRISLEGFTDASPGSEDYTQWTEYGSRLMRKWAERWASWLYYCSGRDGGQPLCPPLRYEFISPEGHKADNGYRVDTYHRYATAQLTLVTASPGTALQRVEARAQDATSMSGYKRQHPLGTFLETHRNSGHWADLLLQAQKDADPSKYDPHNQKPVKAVNNELADTPARPIFVYLPYHNELEVYSLAGLTALSRAKHLRTDLADSDRSSILQNNQLIYEEGYQELAANLDDLITIADHMKSICLHSTKGPYAYIDIRDGKIIVSCVESRFPSGQELTLFTLLVQRLNSTHK